MKLGTIALSLAALLAAPAFAQTPAPAAGNAATVTATCKDGTTYTGTTMKGACRGHHGVDKKAGAGTAAAPAAAATTAAAAPATPAKPAMPMAAGGGDGKVWANDSTKVYHCSGDRYYGKTKHGEYMSESDAKAKGFHPSHGKACAG